MYYQPTTVLIALLATTAAGKPAFGQWPWVSTFNHVNCSKGDGAGDGVDIPTGDCVRFKPIHDSVAVNFGGGLNVVKSISVYTDANCEHPAGKDVTPEYAEQPCLSMSEWGAPWGSVRQTIAGE